MAMNAQPYPAGFEQNVVRFARDLRQARFLLGPQELTLAFEALATTDLARVNDVKVTLRLIFAKTPRERKLFDAYFDHYFGGGLLTPETPQNNDNLPKSRKIKQVSMLDWQQGEQSESQLDTMGYSPQAVEAKGDGLLSVNDVDTLAMLVKRLSKQLFTLPSRRFSPTSRKRGMLDLRRSMRRSLSHGGELMHLQYKARKPGKTRLVFVFDASGSMMVYNQLLLQLAYAFVRQQSLGKAEVFGFSTDLYYLTPALKQGGVHEALRAAQRAMPGRSGGTKIGHCLHTLLHDYSHLLDPKTILIINSDGWDTGELELLKRSMQALHARSHTLIWLNPLAASPGYEPTASGMRTAWPYIDVFAASHNLASLQGLERKLMKRNAW